MLSLGLTGGIASGKSLAARFFLNKGALILDADVAAREAVMPGAPGLAQLVQAFGPGILRASGELDRDKLGALVFAEAGRRQLVDQILHPIILGNMFVKIERLRKQFSAGIVISDIPLLFECNLQDRFDKTILIYADSGLQLRRLMERNGFSEHQARQRLAAQMDIEAKKLLADFVVDNTGTAVELETGVGRVWDALTAMDSGRQ